MLRHKKKLFIFFLALYTSIFCHVKNVVTLFSHGIADSAKQAHKYSKKHISPNQFCTIHTPFLTFNYPDVTDKFYRVNYAETSFGQENEIGRLKKIYDLTLERCENNCDLIMYGISRGASNLLIFAGLYQPAKVKALILESPYYTMSDVIKNIMTKQRLSWLPLSYGETVAEYIFKKYTRYGNSPANCIEKIPQDIPILIICSKEDQLVPHSTSMNVYKKLRETGHEHTYIFATDHGRHAAILQGQDGEQYQNVINAFYKKYNFPFCPDSAAKGESLLSTCQPKID